MSKDMGQDMNLSELMRIASSAEGKQLLELVRQNNDPKFSDAMRLAEKGDYSQAKQMIGKFLETPEAKSIMEKIRGNK